MWTAEGERLPELLVLFRLGLRVAISYIPEDTVLGVFCNGNDFPLLVND
jgi:hypothetical protein